MTKEALKRLIMSIRTSENEEKTNHLLARLDMSSEEEIEKITSGKSEEEIKEIILSKINKERPTERFTPINDVFSYGTNDQSIHLHVLEQLRNLRLPVDLNRMLSNLENKKAMAVVNLYLLHAVDTIKKLRDNGFNNFKDKKTIYMISPILNSTETKFLDRLGFKTNIYTKDQLQDDSFNRDNDEANLAVQKFGKESKVGTATINFGTINSPEWQKRKEEVNLELLEKLKSVPGIEDLKIYLGIDEDRGR